MAVKEISNEPVTIATNQSVIEAAELMDTEGVGALVVEDNETVAGIVTDREIALAVAEHEGDLPEVEIKNVMTEEPTTLQENDESMEAARMMAERGVRRIPVVDDSGSTVGIVSLDDVVSLTGEQLGDAATVIEKQSPGYKP